ncbi:MAG TPA: DUF3343 domain-containing protein [Firmicutes bacterium]|nr:DUF3343 domain-containing protein [Bacillota bacterium]
MDFCYYITFPTVYFALRAEALLTGRPFTFKMVPVPRAISSSCGTALRCSCQDAKMITDFLKQKHVEFESVHRLAEQALKNRF